MERENFAHDSVKQIILHALWRAGIAPEAIVLNIPCGVGNDLKYILPVTEKVVCIDIALRAIKELKATYRQKNGFCHLRLESA